MTGMSIDARVEDREGARGVVAAWMSATAVGATLFALVDTLVAWRIGSARPDALTFVGCAAGAFAQYALVFAVALGALALVLAKRLARGSGRAAFRTLLCAAFFGGLFAELYWWTRPFVFYGVPWKDPRRLAATAVFAAGSFAVAFVAARFLADVLARVARAWIAVAGVACLGGALFLASQGSVLDGEGVVNERTRERPNVLIVVIDALRQDTLGCHGHPRVKTPAIDRLAREGVVFENAFTQAPFTWTSFGSLLTGKYPRRHGLVRMAPGKRMRPNVTIAQHLETAPLVEGGALVPPDYFGATFHTGTLSTGSGLLRGFDVYYEQLEGHGIVAAKSTWSVFRSDLLLWILASKVSQRFGDETAVAAVRWLAQHERRRFVSMVHLYSTHTPYDPEARFARDYVDPNYKGPLKAFYAAHREAIERGEATPTPADVAHIENLYLGGVAQADERVGRLVAELERQGTLDDTLIIVTSDHGESLGERSLWEFNASGLWEHNHMVQTNLRIPLVMRWPKGLKPGTRVGALVDSIDVLPTVCELARIELPNEAGELGIVDGKSLVPLVRGEASALREFSFAENGLQLSIQDLRWKLVVPVSMVEDCAQAKFGPEDMPPALFDLATDPHEQTNLFAKDHAEYVRLFAALCAWNATMPYAVMDTQMSPREIEDQKRRMSALGYMDGVGAEEAPEPEK